MRIHYQATLKPHTISHYQHHYSQFGGLLNGSSCLPYVIWLRLALLVSCMLPSAVRNRVNPPAYT